MNHLNKNCSQSSLISILFLLAVGMTILVMDLPKMSLESASAQPPFNINLTGTWKADDGGIYYIRNIGNDVWWLGISGSDDGKTFSNVLKGYFHKNNGTIIAEYADIPKGSNKYHGTLTLSIESDTLLQKINETGYEANGNPSCCFGATKWER